MGWDGRSREPTRCPLTTWDPWTVIHLFMEIGRIFNRWLGYFDLNKRTAKPSAEVVARTVSVTRRHQGPAAGPGPFAIVHS